ncbi:MAG: radical SAM protein [Verrucomicrobiia bacterium]|jgi:radical SAM enzyme (TIGR01210 family)
MNIGFTSSVYPADKTDRTRWIVQRRPPKNQVNSARPLAFFVEKEPFESGIEDVVSIVLVNRECPWRCLMCDLWKNTTNSPVAPGDIPRQVKQAFENLGISKTENGQVHSGRRTQKYYGLKLYNAGSFFDVGAILPQDYREIGRCLTGFRRLVVESHPLLIRDNVKGFREVIIEEQGNDIEIEIAMGLETANPDVLSLLNKGMKLEDFAIACQYLLGLGIDVRAFILLNPPFMTDEGERIKWAIRSAQFAFDCGVSKVVLIPVRKGNGAIDELEAEGSFSPISLLTVEYIFESILALRRGIAMVDLWDIGLLKENECQRCFEHRVERLRKMNLGQRVLPKERCLACGL